MVSCMLCRLVEWMTGFTCTMHLVATKLGSQWNHQTCLHSWSCKPADIGTKRLPSSRLRSLMAMLEMFNMSTGLVEGSDDLGASIYCKKQSSLSVLSVLSLVQLKGCNSVGVDETAHPGLGLLAFTVVLGLFFIFPECVARVPFHSGGLGVEGVLARRRPTVRNRSQPFATVRNRSQPSATVIFATVRNCSREGRMAVPMVVAAFRVAGVALRDIQTCFLTCGKSFVWQAQYFCDVLVALF